MKKKIEKKLSLNKETLQALNAKETNNLKGGYWTEVFTCIRPDSTHPRVCAPGCL